MPRALLLTVATLLIGLAFAIGSAEASGDEFGDSFDSTGGIVGDLNDVLGPSDGVIVHIGADETGGSVTVSFENNVAFDGPGDDIRIHTVDTIGPATALIEVSDGTTWVGAGSFGDDVGNVDIDLGPLGLPYAVAVRITHESATKFPGFDLDAVEALNQIDLEDVGLLLAPPTGENPVFTEHTVTATLTDDGTSVAGALVTFLITAGPNSAETVTVATDGLGEASFTWLGDDGAGLDEITAWLDVNGDGIVDTDEPSTTAEKQWRGVTGTIDLTDVDGGGVVVGDLLQVTVDDSDLDVSDAPDTIDVLVFSDSDGTGFMLTLTETGDHTGVFQGLFELGDATDAGSRVLQATNGDVVTASYDDELDGEGADPDPVNATLDVGHTEEEGLKVTLCHVPGGNPANQHTIIVGSSAVKSHLGNHGDTRGECGEYHGPTKKELFCERKAGDHRRCEESATDESIEALEANEPGALSAFCERKPDHQRCADYEGDAAGAEAFGSEDDGDSSNDETGDGRDKDKNKGNANSNRHDAQ